MAEETRFQHLQVFCPECQRMIAPGEYTMCPYFEGGALDVSDEEETFAQLFRCHVKCGCTIEYHYYKDGERVTKRVDSVANEAMLREILKRVMKHK